MRNTGLLIMVLFLYSCLKKPEYIEPRFKFDNITLTEFTWHRPEPYTKYSFYVGKHLKIDSSGNYFVFRRDTFMHDGNYYTNQLPIYFDSIISNIDFLNMDSIYHDTTFQRNYCGLTYCLTYQSKDVKTKKYIRFIPGTTPSFFQNFIDSLDNMIDTTHSTLIQPFDYSEISHYISSTLEDTSKLPKYVGILKFQPPK